MMFVHYSIDDVVGVFEELTKKQDRLRIACKAV